MVVAHTAWFDILTVYQNRLKFSFHCFVSCAKLYLSYLVTTPLGLMED